MNDRKAGDPEIGDADDFLIEEDESEDLEAAIREALEAVEKSSGDEAGAEVRSAAPTAALQGVEEAGGDAEAEQISQMQDRLMRTLADFDNFRKRTERERQEQRRYEGFELLRDFLAIADNLERAIEAGGSLDDLKTGMSLILRQIKDLFERAGVQRIPTEGETFDPRVHEAMARVEEDVAEPMVSEELQPGYSMHDRLLRPARVKVAMPASEREASD